MMGGRCKVFVSVVRQPTTAGTFTTKFRARFKDTDKTDPDLSNNLDTETTTVNP